MITQLEIFSVLALEKHVAENSNTTSELNYFLQIYNLTTQRRITCLILDSS